MVVARYYLAAGTLDTPAFTASGFATLQIENDSRAYAVALQPDGKIVIGGYSGSLTEPYPNRFARSRDCAGAAAQSRGQIHRRPRTPPL